MHYAQNGISSDLIPFGKVIIGEKQKIEICIEKTVSASDIYITVNDVKVREIKLYEVFEEKVKNYYSTHFDIFEKIYNSFRDCGNGQIRIENRIKTDI